MVQGKGRALFLFFVAFHVQVIAIKQGICIRAHWRSLQVNRSIDFFVCFGWLVGVTWRK